MSYTTRYSSFFLFFVYISSRGVSCRRHFDPVICMAFMAWCMDQVFYLRLCVYVCFVLSKVGMFRSHFLFHVVLLKLYIQSK
jgi:hypothetical protein